MEIIEPENLIFKKVIGDGSTSVVYKALWTDEQINVAVKKFDNFSSRFMKDFKKEIEILSKINHENVIKILGYCDKRHETYIVNELMEGRSLYEYIHNDDFDLTTDLLLTLNLIENVVDGMLYLHDHDILHLDLKPSNILLDKTKKIAKINDFGLSKINSMSITKTKVITSAKGTIRYMSPEIAKGADASFESDVWSFGCILIEILKQKVPFHKYNENVIFLILQNDEADLKLDIDDDSYPKILKDLTNDCLKRKKHHRATFLSIKKELKNFNRNKIELKNKSEKITAQTNIESNVERNQTKNFNELENKFNSLIIEKEKEKEKKDSSERDKFRIENILPFIFSTYKSDSYNYNNNSYNSSTSTYIHKNSSYSISSNHSNAIRTGERYVSNGSANGREIFMGPRGGKFYYTPTGNKRYL